MLCWFASWNFLRNICWRILSYDFPGKWGSSVLGNSVILVPTVKIDRYGQARNFRYRPKSSLKKSCAKAVWKSSGQNPVRRVNDSVALSGEKDTEFEKRSYLLYSSFVSRLSIFSSWARGRLEKSLQACCYSQQALCYLVPCKQQGAPFLFTLCFLLNCANSVLCAV